MSWQLAYDGRCRQALFTGEATLHGIPQTIFNPGATFCPIDGVPCYISRDVNHAVTYEGNPMTAGGFCSQTARGGQDTRPFLANWAGQNGLGQTIIGFGNAPRYPRAPFHQFWGLF